MPMMLVASQETMMMPCAVPSDITCLLPADASDAGFLVPASRSYDCTVAMIDRPLPSDAAEEGFPVFVTDGCC